MVKFGDMAMGLLFLAAAGETFALIRFYSVTTSLTWLFAQLFLANLTLYGFFNVFIYPFFFSPLRHLPGPYGGLFGNAVEASFGRPRGDKLRQWMEEIPNNGIIRFREWFNRDAIMLTSHATLKECLNERCYDYEKKPRVRDILKRVLGDGLILVEGNEHKFQRKHLLPSFQVKVIRDLYPTFWSKACQLTNLMAPCASETETELGDWCTRVTLDIIGIAGFGRDFNSLTNPHDDFVAQYHDILEPAGEKALYFGLNMAFPHWLVNLIPFWEIPRKLNSISANLHTFAYELARERRAELANPNNEKASQRNDILSLLVKSNDFSDRELAHQVLTMMAAGHETTSSTLSWVLYLLATHPEYQTRLREEVRGALPSPSSSETISASVVDSMPLLNGVCNETLRLYPTVPTTTRHVVNDTVLQGQKIPKDTSVFVAMWAVNRCTKFWGADAQKFVPERWVDRTVREDGSEKVTLNNNGGAASNYDIMTFLHGPRSCIGQGFARSELKCLLAALVGRYSFETTREESRYVTAGLVTTKPAYGMWLKVTEIPGW